MEPGRVYVIFLFYLVLSYLLEFYLLLYFICDALQQQQQQQQKINLDFPMHTEIEEKRMNRKPKLNELICVIVEKRVT